MTDLPALSPHGLYVILEGVDGCGKTTQARLLTAALQKRYDNDRVVLTQEPTKGPYGRQLRILLREGNPRKNGEELLRLFVADRQEHLDTFVVPRLQEGKMVIQDRGKYSTIAYQSAQGIPLESILAAHQGICSFPMLF